MKNYAYFIFIFVVVITIFSLLVKDVQKLRTQTLVLKNEIYGQDIYRSQLIDLYFIAASLYYNFEDSSVVNDGTKNVLYDEVIEFYSRHSEHNFIKNLHKYLDTYNSDIDSNFLMALVRYLLFDCTKESPFNKIVLEEFVADISEFYSDTNSHNFFENSYQHYNSLDNFINNIDFGLLDNLISEIDIYLERKDFSENQQYTIVFSLFRPYMASFYNSNDNYIAILSPYGIDRDFEYNENQIIKTLVHEILHCYINEHVHKYEDYILQNVEMFNWHKSEFNTRAPYANMDWHRIFDENLVRAVQAKIYYTFFKSEDAIDYILRDEYEIGGFKKAYDFYDSLDAYEISRNIYDGIKEYIPQIINKVFER